VNGLTRVVLSDSRAVVRSGLRHILTAAGLVVVGETRDVVEAAALIGAITPDVVVAGVRESEIGIVRRLRDAYRRVGVVVMSAGRDPERAHSALRAGASAYLLGDATEEEIVQAVKTAATGATYAVSRRVLPNRSEHRPAIRGAGGDLSPREEQVLRLLALGHTNTEIARELTISVRTVESHRLHIQQKLGRPSRAELFRIADSFGLLDEIDLTDKPPTPLATVQRLDAEGISA
jgi:two-component system response regulator NreC